MRKLILIVTLSIFTHAFSQQGVSGVVYDGEFSEPLPFANVVVKGQAIGTTTDFDGRYYLDLMAGTYELEFSFVGYDKLGISEISVSAGKTTIIDAILNPSANALEEVIVTTTARKNSETAVLNNQKKAVNVIDGLSIQSMRKAGDGELAAAVKRVPGISVQGGKFVYVRGLGDRYTKTMINGVEIPGLDPNKNTVEMDIFPSSIVENVLVNKTKTSNLPSDFTGGLVNLKLKDFSETNAFSLGYSASYNPQMHFKDNFLRDKKTSSDWLARDGGYRQHPYESPDFAPISPLFFLPEADLLTKKTRMLHNHMKPIQDKSFMNYKLNFGQNHSFSLGGDKRLGVFSSLIYSYDTSLLDDFYGSTSIMFRDELQNYNSFEGNNSSQDVNITYILGLALKNKYSKFSVKYLSINDSSSIATYFDGVDYIDNEYTFAEHGLYYTEKKLKFLPATFFFTNEDGNTTVELTSAIANVEANDKDFKTTPFENIGGKQYISINTTGVPERLWRGISEDHFTLKGDLTHKFDLFNQTQKINLGFYFTKKERTFYSFNYNINFKGNSSLLNGNPNNVLLEENIWKKDLSSWRYGAYLKPAFDDGSQYESGSTTEAYFVSADLSLLKRVKINLGLRFENYKTTFTGIDYFGETYNKSVILDNVQLFPNANITYDLNENLKLRGAYYRSSANPSFKESSPITFYDPVERIRYTGNLDLKPSFINNFDLRLEWYGSANEIIALSAYSKIFKDPIEVNAFSELFYNEFIARNGKKSTVKGLELEIRKNIFTNDKTLIFLNSNISYVDAKRPVEKSSPLFPFQDYRELQGQSPYMINTGINYQDNNGWITSGLFYNVQGKTLDRVGIGVQPGVYIMPFHDLSFNSSLKFGENKNKVLTIKINNLLNQKYQSKYIQPEQPELVFRSYSPGIEYSIGMSFKF